MFGVIEGQFRSQSVDLWCIDRFVTPESRRERFSDPFFFPDDLAFLLGPAQSQTPSYSRSIFEKTVSYRGRGGSPLISSDRLVALF